MGMSDDHADLNLHIISAYVMELWDTVEERDGPGNGERDRNLAVSLGRSDP